jgi:hypothetical protein
MKLVKFLKEASSDKPYRVHELLKDDEFDNQPTIEMIKRSTNFKAVMDRLVRLARIEAHKHHNHTKVSPVKKGFEIEPIHKDPNHPRDFSHGLQPMGKKLGLYFNTGEKDSTGHNFTYMVTLSYSELKQIK